MISSDESKTSLYRRLPSVEVRQFIFFAGLYLQYFAIYYFHLMYQPRSSKNNISYDLIMNILFLVLWFNYREWELELDKLKKGGAKEGKPSLGRAIIRTFRYKFMLFGAVVFIEVNRTQFLILNFKYLFNYEHVCLNSTAEIVGEF